MMSRSLRRACKSLLLVTVAMGTLLGIMVHFNRWTDEGRADDILVGGKEEAATVAKDAVPIIVVEEHYEVLPYWFDAAKTGKIPTTRNVLLHIDGHSDDAPPEMTKPNFPRYRWPRTKEEMRAMMQSNDMFIVAAVQAGLFERTIWVWPEWDRVNHDADHQVMTVEFGETTAIPGRNIGPGTFCACRSLHATPPEHLCHIVNRTLLEEAMHKDPDTGLDKFEIRDDQCLIKGKYVAEEISEGLAVQKMRSGKLIRPGESLLVDVDEDYFGCVSAGTEIVKSGVSWHLVKRVSLLLDALICPRRTKHEAEAEDFMMPIVTEAIRLCQDSDETCEGYEEQLILFALDRIQKGIRRKLPFLCRRDLAKESKITRAFVHHLLGFNRKNLQAIAHTGMCMMTSPKSILFSIKKFRGVGSFQICTGFNDPDDNIVIYFSPTRQNVTARIQILHDILVRGKYPNPKLVTVCRSMRDGYVPRDHFEVIEEGIISAFTQKLGFSNHAVFYDRDLLGGPAGWPQRHKRFRYR